MDRHEWTDRCGMSWVVELTSDTDGVGRQMVRFTETPSYGSIHRSYSEIGAEILRLAAALAAAEAERDEAARRLGVANGLIRRAALALSREGWEPGETAADACAALETHLIDLEIENDIEAASRARGAGS